MPDPSATPADPAPAPHAAPVLPLHPRACLAAMLAAAAALVALHLVFAQGAPHGEKLAKLFNLDEEHNVPTWFSSALLNAAALVALACAWVEGRVAPARLSDRLTWAGIVLLFFGLSIEEIVGLHEMVSRRSEWVPLLDGFFGSAAPMVRDLFGRGYRYSWIVFYAPLIVLVVVFLLRFVTVRFRRYPQLRRTLLLAVAIYVGVIVLETLAKSQRDDASLMVLLVVVEEFLEMAGSAVFVYGFLSYLELQLDALARRALRP